MSGSLTFCSNHIPKTGDPVYIIVEGESFPTGVWKGILTYVQDLGEIIPDHPEIEFHTFCTAEILDARAPKGWNRGVPRGMYEVYPCAPGMEAILQKLNDQKAEVKSLKRQIEERKKFLGELVKMMKEDSGVEIFIPE